MTSPNTTADATTAETTKVATGEGTLTVQAPDGAHFEYDEVHNAKGENSLGKVPLLTWDDPQKMLALYGNDGVLAIVNGTALRVTAQGIARRLRVAGKSDDEIAQAQIEYRPGARQIAAQTPASQARRAVENAVKVRSDKAETITKLLERLASGEISDEELERLAGQ